MEILEDIMSEREGDDDEDEGGDDDEDDPEPPLPVSGKGKKEVSKANSKDKATQKPVQSFTPGQGFGRPPAPPPTKGF